MIDTEQIKSLPELIEKVQALEELEFNRVHKFITVLGDGLQTTFDLRHDLRSDSVIVSVIDTVTSEPVDSSNYEIRIASEHLVKISFEITPSERQYRVIIVG